jgi:DNA-binding response OmpR family regulator
MKRILIIEDEPEVASSIKIYLEKQGYEVQFTLDPMAGLEMLHKFDLLLLDLIMPKMPGRQVLREMKKRKMTIPVIVLTAVGLPRTTGEELGRVFPGVRLVPKTEMFTELIPTIKSMLKE